MGITDSFLRGVGSAGSALSDTIYKAGGAVNRTLSDVAKTPERLSPWLRGEYAAKEDYWNAVREQAESETRRTVKQGYNQADETSALENELASIEEEMRRLNRTPAPVQIPEFDIYGATQKAAKKAASQVNPYFDSQLERFRQKQTEKRERAREDYETQVGELQDRLNQYLQEADIKEERTIEDTQRDVANILSNEELRQRAEGVSFGRQEGELRDKLATAGLTYSGLGQQQLEEGRQDRGLTEEAKQEVVDRKVANERLFKNRTIEDLARGRTQEQKTFKRGKTKAEREKERELWDLNIEERIEETKTELERMNQLAEEESRQYERLWRDYLQGLTPRQIKAAEGTYTI